MYWKIRTVASYFPENVLRFLHKHFPLWKDPCDGWSIWVDASYERYVRNDKAKNA